MKTKPITKEGYKLFHDGVLAFSKAEQVGMRVDTEYCKKANEELTEEIENLRDELMEMKLIKHWKHYFGESFNLNSNHQLGKLLYDIRGIEPVKTTPSGKGSTDEESLSELDIPALDKLLEMRKLLKIRDTYLEGFAREQVRGRIHPIFNLHLAVTFRSSAQAPNFQNIPKRDEKAKEITRKAIYPRKGNQLLSVDYSGIEVRIAAAYHQDPNMIKYIKEPESDMHGDMACQIFFLDEMDKSNPKLKRLRSAAKNGFTFPQFYGDYYVNCAEYLGVKWGELPKKRFKPGQGIKVTEDKHLSDWLMENGVKSYQAFERHIEEIEDDFWNRRFRDYKQWKDDMWNKYREKGYLDMKTGFRYSGTMRRNKVLNAPIQGSAFHCLLWSFIRLTEISEEEDWNTKLVGQIHDEIMLDVDPDELEHVKKTTKRVMCEDLKEHWPWINVPIDIDADITPVNGSWYEQEECEI